MNSFSRIYLTGFTRRNTIDWGNRWGAIDGAEFMRVTPKLPKLPKLAGIRLIMDDFECESETVGGFTIETFGRFPKAGESVETDGMKITVIEMESHRVGKVLVSRAAASS